MTEFFNSFLGEPYGQYASAFVALLVVLVLLILVLRIMKSLRGGSFGGRQGAGARLEVVEFAPVDDERHIVLVRRDNVEHLLLIGGQGDVVVESGISAEHGSANVDVQEKPSGAMAKVGAAFSTLTAIKTTDGASTRQEPDTAPILKAKPPVFDEKNAIEADELNSMMSELPWKKDA